MKILFLIETLRPGAGMERMATSLANELAQRKWDVNFAVLDTSAESYFELDSSIGIRVMGQGKGPKSIFRLRKIIKESNYSRIVNVGVQLSRVSLPACLGLKKAKVVTWEHFELYVGSRKGYYWRLLSAKISWKTVVLTSRDRNNYLNRVKADVVSISNFTSMPIVERSDDYAKEILSVGRLTTVKGFDLLLRAWAIAAPQAEGWKLRIVGSGTEESSLKELSGKLELKERIIFTPATNNVGEYYRRAGLYALSSRLESFALVLIEAKCYGLPCVSFDGLNGPEMIVRSGVDGLLVERGNVAALAEGMLTLIKDKDMNRHMGKAGQEDIAKRFDKRIIVDQWEKLLM